MSLNSEKIIFWGFVSLLLGGFSYVIYSQETMTPEEKHTQSLRNQCSSKARGSRPHCWSEDDWKAFCEHIECKTQSHKE